MIYSTRARNQKRTLFGRSCIIFFRPWSFWKRNRKLNYKTKTHPILFFGGLSLSLYITITIIIIFTWLILIIFFFKFDEMILFFGLIQFKQNKKKKKFWSFKKQNNYDFLNDRSCYIFYMHLVFLVCCLCSFTTFFLLFYILFLNFNFCLMLILFFFCCCWFHSTLVWTKIFRY